MKLNEEIFNCKKNNKKGKKGHNLQIDQRICG